MSVVCCGNKMKNPILCKEKHGELYIDLQFTIQQKSEVRIDVQKLVLKPSRNSVSTGTSVAKKAVLVYNRLFGLQSIICGIMYSHCLS